MRKNIYSMLCLLLVGCLAGCTTDIIETPTRRDLYFIGITQSKEAGQDEMLQRAAEQGVTNFLPPSASNYALRIRIDAIRYYTTDPQGNPTIASGIISYPKNGHFKGVVVGEHYTIGDNRAAPSERMFSVESLFSFLDYVVIAPDYIGYGATVHLPHPYLHVESAGRVSADMVIAARQYMESIGHPIEKEVSVVGYSEGGAVALAFQKMAEEYYAAEIPVKQVIAGGGPYDLVASLNYFIKANYISYPCSVPLVVIGLDYGDNLKLDYSKVFQEPLLSNYPEWIGSKRYTTGKINKFIGTHVLSDFMDKDLFTAAMNPELRKLYLSFEKNNLINWTPKASLILVHGRKDEYVPYFNAQDAYNAFAAKGCKVKLVTTEWGHVATSAPFYKLAVDELRK